MRMMYKNVTYAKNTYKILYYKENGVHTLEMCNRNGTCILPVPVLTWSTNDESVIDNTQKLIDNFEESLKKGKMAELTFLHWDGNLNK